MVEEGQDWKDVSIPGTPAPPAAAPAAAPPVATSGQPLTAAVQEFHFIHPSQTGPAAALLLSQYRLNPQDIEGSGPKGNLTKSDVLQYIQVSNRHRLTLSTSNILSPGKGPGDPSSSPSPPPRLPTQGPGPRRAQGSPRRPHLRAHRHGAHHHAQGHR